MARHVSSDSSDGEGIAPVRVKAKSNKENTAPAFSLTNGNDISDAKASKQQPTKRSASASAASKKSSTAAKSSKSSKSKAARDQVSDQEDQQPAEEPDVEMRRADDLEDDTVEETQEEVQASKKAVKKSGAKTKKVVSAEEDEETPRERRLRAKLELSEANREKMQELYQRLQDTRMTKAEESEQQLTLIAAERQDASYNTLALYKQENDDLRSEIAELRSSGLSTTSPRASSKPSFASPSRARIVELEEALSLARKELDAAKDEAGQSARKELEERDGKWERELQRTVKAKDEEASRKTKGLERDLAQSTKDLSALKQELEAEIEHSKSLQQKLKSAPLTSSNALSAPSSSSSTALQRLTDELETLKMHLALNEDLTGFSVVSVKSEQMGEVYNCILSDCLAVTGSLTFKLTFHPDETVSYTPDVDPSRDAALAEVLPQELQGYMRFDADKSSEWFRKMFYSVNKLRG